VPARVEGLWCGAGAHQGATLRIAQRFQRFDVTLARAADRSDFSGRIDGETLRPETGAASFALRVRGEQLEVLPPAAGGFRRAGPGGC
jgi:hypothetical protein